MSKDEFEHIRMATNERLAEMLSEIASSYMLIAQANKKAAPVCKEYHAIMMEAASRLRTKHKTPFNSEAFE